MERKIDRKREIERDRERERAVNDKFRSHGISNIKRQPVDLNRKHKGKKKNYKGRPINRVTFWEKDEETVLKRKFPSC